MLKSLIKSGESLKALADILADLVKNVALLGKTSFNKQIGIEPIVLKIFVPLLPLLFKEGP